MAEPRRPLGEGAAQAAPTAPHATPRAEKGRRSGPERFWAKWPVRVTFVLALAVSGAAHCSMMPLRLPGSVDVNDFDGEAAIPIDLLEQGEPASQVAQEPPPAPAETASPADDGKQNDPTAALARRDAGAPRDGGPADAAPVDGAADAEATDAAASVDGAVALASDAGPGDGGPQDPDALLASSGAVQADVIFVRVVINAIEIRKNPAAAQLTDLLRAIPDWNDFMHGTEGLIDPVRDTDWILISGPSLRDSSKDVVTLHYATSDAMVDKAAEIVSHNYDRGGRYDVGVPGTRAWLAHADFAERVIERPRSHVLLIVPPANAAKSARDIQRVKDIKQNIMPGVATYVQVKDPHHALPELIPEGITDMRLKVRARDDGGADVDIEGDCKDEATCKSAVGQVSRTIGQQNSGIISFATGGLLDRVDVSAEGQTLRVHLTATASQIAKTIAALQLVLPSLVPAPPAAQGPRPQPPPMPPMPPLQRTPRTPPPGRSR